MTTCADIAERINRKVLLRQVMIDNLRVKDKTNEEYLRRGRRINKNAKEFYDLKADERQKDAQLLQNFIDNFNK